jgi:hypothetical protein
VRNYTNQGDVISVEHIVIHFEGGRDMPTIRIRGLVGKLSVDPNLFTYDSFDNIMSHVVVALKHPTKPIFERDGKIQYYWVLEGAHEFIADERDSHPMVAGIIRRGTHIGAVEKWDFSLNRPDEELVEDMTLRKFAYLFDPATETVVIQQSGKTNPSTLMATFAHLVDINSQVKLSNLTVLPYRTLELLDALSAFSKITRVKLCLIAANPEQDEDWADIEELILTRPGAKKANIELIGEDLQQDRTIIEQGAKKVIKAQGDSLVVEGIGQDGQVRRVNSKDFTYTDSAKAASTAKGVWMGLSTILQHYIGGGRQ